METSRVAYGDDRQHRREENALLKGVLVQQKAQRADDGQSVDRPVREHLPQAAAEIRGHELDHEGRDTVGDAAR